MDRSIDRRSHARKSLRVPATITYRDSDGQYVLPAVTRDLTPDGAFLELTSVPPLQGMIVQLAVGPPQHTVALSAMVVHFAADGLGLMFTRFDQAPPIGLAALINPA